MAHQPSTERKSADSLAFEHYLRTGQKLSVAEWLAREERKFNPYHDERGRFTFAPGGAGMAGAPLAPQSGQGARQIGQVRAGASAGPSALPRTRVAAMPGYPETPRTAWRSSNDLAFIAAADFYNRKYGLRPDGQGYKTPEFLKGWAMRETGGEGNEKDFRTDPFQVNNAEDWDDKKQEIAGLRKGQKMTPAVSAYAALEWLRYKAQRRDGRGNIIGYRDDQEALERYNHNFRRTRQSGARPHYVWYAETIMQMAGQAPKVKP